MTRGLERDGMDGEKRAGTWALKPISLREAKEFVDAHHRHNMGAQWHKFSIGLERDGELVGVVTVGRPVARGLDDGRTCEVTRVCVLDGVRNANTRLYGAALRAAKAMGYRRAVTYTLAEENGSSVKAAGFRRDGRVKGRDWNTLARPRRTCEAVKYPRGDKTRWLIEM